MRELFPRVAMRDIGISSNDIEAMVPVYRTAGLAMEAICRLIAIRGSGAIRVLDHLVDLLFDAARAPDDAPVRDVLSQMRKAHVSDLAIVTHYIPEAARRLGAGWENDSLTFLDVTVGSARLSELVAEVGGGWKGDDVAQAGQSTVLIVVPPGEQHTLGVVVLACILRQTGISVCLRFGPSLTELAALLATRHFDGAMVSLGSAEKVESCAVLVKTLHALGKGALPVAVGGAVIDAEEDLKARTGAEIVSNDLDAALALFGVVSKEKT